MERLKRIFRGGPPKDVGREIVRSNFLASVGFDPDRGVLQIEFLNGRVYEIHKFDESQFEKHIKYDWCDQTYQDLDLSRMTFVGQEHPLWG